jgi:hypothetical protein
MVGARLEYLTRRGVDPCCGGELMHLRATAKHVPGPVIRWWAGRERQFGASVPGMAEDVTASLHARKTNIGILASIFLVATGFTLSQSKSCASLRDYFLLPSSRGPADDPCIPRSCQMIMKAGHGPVRKV